MNSNQMLSYGQCAIYGHDLKCPITEGIAQLQYGDLVVVKGRPAHKGKGFSINLKDKSKKKILLHINVRFNENQIVVNTHNGKNWEKEKRNQNMYVKSGQLFTCLVSILRDRYRVSFNKRHVCNYEHKGEATLVCAMNIQGEVVIDHFYTQKSVKSLTSSQPTPPEMTNNNVQEPQTSTESSNTFGGFMLPVPYSERLPFTMANKRTIYLTILPHNSSHSCFAINLRTGREEAHPIAMHLAVRFQGSVAVFNNKDHGKWGSEVQMKDNFPFKRGVHADIAILCTIAGFAMSVNNQHYYLFQHRVQDVKSINIVQVRGDASLVRLKAK